MKKMHMHASKHARMPKFTSKVISAAYCTASSLEAHESGDVQQASMADEPSEGLLTESEDAQPDITPAPALREDQIQNAVAFLSHPKVRHLNRCLGCHL